MVEAEEQRLNERNAAIESKRKQEKAEPKAESKAESKTTKAEK
jgi:hypothetical protein